MNIEIERSRIIRLLVAAVAGAVLSLSTAKSDTTDVTNKNDLLHELSWNHSGSGNFQPTIEVIVKHLPPLAEGSMGAGATHESYSVAKFDAGGVYTARLDMSTREEGKIASFMFGGMPAADPDKGAILNVDGAILGFEANTQGGPHSYFCTMMAQTRGANGERIWVTTRLKIYALSTMRGAMSPLLNIKFNRTAKTWDLYVNNKLLVKDLVLMSDSSLEPRITLEGDKAGSPVILKRLEFGTALRGDNFPAMASGQAARSAAIR